MGVRITSITLGMKTSESVSVVQKIMKKLMRANASLRRS